MIGDALAIIGACALARMLWRWGRSRPADRSGNSGRASHWLSNPRI